MRVLDRGDSRSRGPQAGAYLVKPAITRKPVAGVEWNGVEWSRVRRQEHSDEDIVIIGLGGGATWQAHCKDFR